MEGCISPWVLKNTIGSVYWMRSRPLEEHRCEPHLGSPFLANSILILNLYFAKGYPQNLCYKNFCNLMGNFGKFLKPSHVIKLWIHHCKKKFAQNIMNRYRHFIWLTDDTYNHLCMQQKNVHFLKLILF